MAVANGKVFLYQLSHETVKAPVEYEYILDGVYMSNAPVAVLKGNDGKLHYDVVQTLWTDSTFTWYGFNILYPKTKALHEIHSPGIVRSDGKVVLEAGALRYMAPLSFAGKPIYRVGAFLSGNEGIMDIDGNFLIDTTWQLIQPESRDLYWVRGKSIAGSTGCYSPWNKYQLSTKKLLFPLNEQFIEPVHDTTKNSVAFTTTGGGIYNPKLKKFVLAPVYSGIYNLNLPADKYAIMTCSGHVGICNQNGKILSDTTWTAVHHLSASNVIESQPNSKSERYIFSNEKSWIIYDTEKGITAGDSSLMLAVINEAQKQEGWSENKYATGRFCRECPWLKAAGTESLLQWQKQLLFDSLIHSSVAIDYRIGRHERNNCGCAHPVTLPWDYNGRNRPTPYKLVHHTLQYKTDSVLILERACSFENEDPYKWMAIYHSFKFTYSNIFLFPDGQRVMKLDSLFTGEEWKKVIENAAMNYLREHPGIEASCSDPSMYPKILNELFLINSNGLLFYPQWSYHDEKRRKERITFLIPWAAVRPYLRKDVADKLNLH
jgi:hypothetical protein